MALTLSQADEEKELINDIKNTVEFMEKEIEWTKQRPPFERYLRLIIHLHKEIAQGRGGEEAADEIRDETDTPHSALAPWQKALLDDLSAALYNDSETDDELRVLFQRKEKALKIYNAIQDIMPIE